MKGKRGSRPWPWTVVSKLDLAAQSRRVLAGMTRWKAASATV